MQQIHQKKKYQEENDPSKAPELQFAHNAIWQTFMDNCWPRQESEASRKQFYDDCLERFCNGGAKIGEKVKTTGVLRQKYDEVFRNQETTWFEQQRAAGTLPWTHATQEEKNAASLSESDRQRMYDEKIQALSAKYHNYSPAV